jgi:multiple sugar transport system permease protein
MAVQTRSAPTGLAAARRPVNVARVVRRSTIYGLLGLWSVISFFPLYWVITTSIKSPNDVYAGPKYVPFLDFMPSGEGWEAATLGMFRALFFLALANSTVISVTSAALSVLFGSLAGYGLARFNYTIGRVGNKDISIWFISQIVLPPATVLFPLLILFKTFSLLDTRQGLILLYTAFNLPAVVWIMRDHFAGMPIELEESAMIDGCSRVGTFLRIALPLALPGVIAAYLLVLVFTWNEYFLAVNLTSADAQTMPVLIAGQSTGRGLLWWSMSAMATASIAPMVIIGLVLERYIVKGLTAGAVRG